MRSDSLNNEIPSNSPLKHRASSKVQKPYKNHSMNKKKNDLIKLICQFVIQSRYEKLITHGEARYFLKIMSYL
jgi:hypothetical protein